MALSYPPVAPQRGDRTTFAARVDAFITWLIGFVSELIAVVANLNSIAAGGAYSIQYTYRSSSSFVGSATGGILAIKAASIQLDTKSLGGASVAALLSATGDSTSTLKGLIRLQKVNDTSKWAVYSVTSYVQGGSGLYGDIFGTLVNSSTGSNPFSDGESVMLFFDRTGDKGDQGATGAAGAPASFNLLGSYTVSTAVAQIDFLSLFSDTYDKYVIEVQGLTGVAGDTLQMKLAVGGAITAVTYGSMTSPAPASPSTGASVLGLGGAIGASGTTNADVSGTIEVRNARSTTRYKGVGFRGRTGASVYDTEGFGEFTSAASGFRLYFASTNINGGTVRVFGIKNT